MRKRAKFTGDVDQRQCADLTECWRRGRESNPSRRLCRPFWFLRINGLAQHHTLHHMSSPPLPCRSPKLGLSWTCANPIPTYPPDLLRTTGVCRLEGATSYLAWPCAQGQMANPGGRQSRFWYCEHPKRRTRGFQYRWQQVSPGHVHQLSVRDRFR